MQTIKTERRGKIIYLNPRDVLGLFFAKRFTTEARMWFPKPVLPDGYTAEHAFYAPERAQFGIIIFHESFDSVPEGSAYPELSIQWEHVAGWLTDVQVTPMESLP